MESVSLNKNVKLDLIVESVIRFFQEKDFEVVVQSETQKGCEIYAENSSYYKLKGQILVSIEQGSKETSITLRLGGNRNAGYFPYPIVGTVMFGGGYFLLQEIKRREAWTNLRKDFWRHMNQVIK